MEEANQSQKIILTKGIERGHTRNKYSEIFMGQDYTLRLPTEK